MTLLKFIIAVFIFSSCKTKSNDSNFIQQTNPVAKDTTLLTSDFSFVDTLDKYKNFDTLSKDDKVFYIGKVHSKPFGLFQISDTSFVLFQKERQAWFLSDTIILADIVDTKYVDLNGDGFKDIIIAQDYTAAGANSENVVLLYNNKTGLLRHNVSYDLPNIQYDSKKRLIYSAWFGSANHPQEKMVYKTSGDSLIFDKGITYIPDEKTQGEIGTVEFYTEIKGKRIVTKTLKGKADKMFDVFDKEFWDTTDE